MLYKKGPNSKCPKCGYGTTTIQYCTGSKWLACWERKEHLHYTCTRCGYKWKGAVLTPEEELKGYPKKADGETDISEKRI